MYVVEVLVLASVSVSSQLVASYFYFIFYFYHLEVFSCFAHDYMRGFAFLVFSCEDYDNDTNNIYYVYLYLTIKNIIERIPYLPN